MEQVRALRPNFCREPYLCSEVGYTADWGELLRLRRVSCSSQFRTVVFST